MRARSAAVAWVAGWCGWLRRRLLKEAQPGDAERAEITGSFEKFVVDRRGQPVARFSPPVTPEDLAPQLSDLL